MANRNESADEKTRNNTFNGGRSIRVMSVREILTDENGADALQANSEDFNERMMLIKKQLENVDHPIH
jgi:hypothetical protein